MGLHNLAHWQAKLLGKVIVSGVVSWDSHDGTTAIAAQHIVSHPDGHGLLVHWVPCIAACRYTPAVAPCVGKEDKGDVRGSTTCGRWGQKLVGREGEGQGQHNACKRLCI